MVSFSHLPFGHDPDIACPPNYQGTAIARDVLDHGFVALRNLAGPTRRTLMDDGGRGLMPRPFDADDSDPADAARMSFDQMSMERTAAEDAKLCDYLMKNWHTSPFEMIECWLEMKMPIFIARQFVRHRTVSINEVSGRYITLPAEWYIPETVGAAPPKGGAKQGQVDTLDPETQAWFKRLLRSDCEDSYRRYLMVIDKGVAPEHARCFLHVNHYTHWLWKQDLHNMLHFLSLRDHFHAQIEAQMYAGAIDSLLRMFLPGTMELYDKYRRQNARVLKAEFDRLLEAFKAATAFIDSHVADPDITDEMAANWARFSELRLPYDKA